jgi:hypothetical protein
MTCFPNLYASLLKLARSSTPDDVRNLLRERRVPHGGEADGLRVYGWFETPCSASFRQSYLGMPSRGTPGVESLIK